MHIICTKIAQLAHKLAQDIIINILIIYQRNNDKKVQITDFIFLNKFYNNRFSCTKDCEHFSLENY